MQSFWMVYGLHQRPPVYRHKTEASAIEEAKRLARTVPGVEFFVMEATHHVVKNDVRVTVINEDRRAYVQDLDDIPF